MPVPVRALPVLARLPARPDVRPLAESLKVLGDEHRLAIVALLARGELCVCHLVDILALPQSTVSHHVGVLKRAGLVRDRPDERDARWTYYSLDPAAVTRLQHHLAELLGPIEADQRPAPPCPP
jgi:ArsR family transcriptional regulator